MATSGMRREAAMALGFAFVREEKAVAVMLACQVAAHRLGVFGHRGGSQAVLRC